MSGSMICTPSLYLISPTTLYPLTQLFRSLLMPVLLSTSRVPMIVLTYHSTQSPTTSLRHLTLLMVNLHHQSVSSAGNNNVPAEPRRSRRVAGVELPQTIFAQRAYSRPSLGRSIVAFLMLASSASALTSCPISPGFAYDQCTAPVCDDPMDVVTAAAHAHAVTITSDFGDVRVPKTYAQALSSTHAAYWREAINKELAGLMKLNTWVCIPEKDMPLESNLMHCHFVFAVKRKADGSIEKFKARLVADGNTQKYGVDFDRIFSSVVKTVTIRLVLAIAAARDYNLSSIDVRQAYLQASLNRDLYMRMPPGLPRFNRAGARLVCKLLRSLYGLRQAGREWAALFSAFLLQWGFTRSDIDVCLYTYSAGDDILWVLVYVDDALIVDNSPALRQRFVADLSNRFPIEDKGELSWILNVGISRDRSRRTLTMSQSLYVSDMRQRYSSYVATGNTRHFAAPLNDRFELDPADAPSIGSPNMPTWHSAARSTCKSWAV